jgi:hypothetical protein
MTQANPIADSRTETRVCWFDPPLPFFHQITLCRMGDEYLAAVHWERILSKGVSLPFIGYRITFLWKKLIPPSTWGQWANMIHPPLKFRDRMRLAWFRLRSRRV